MKKNMIILILATIGIFSCQHSSNSMSDIVNVETAESVKNVERDKSSTDINDSQIYTKYEYVDSNGAKVIIQNGFPRGGVKYTDPKGNVCGYAVFWTQIINETNHPLKLNIDLPENSYEISNFPGKYFKVLAPDDTFTPKKFPLAMYGLKNIESFLDNNIHKPSSFKRIISPKESSGFYFLMLVLTEQATGMTRTELTLKGNDLFYKISRYSMTKPSTLIDEKEIHCGSINIENLRLQK